MSNDKDVSAARRDASKRTSRPEEAGVEDLKRSPDAEPPAPVDLDLAHDRAS